MFFIEILMNNAGKTSTGTSFLQALIKAKDGDEAKQIALDHYRPLYTAGDNGRYHVQCCWPMEAPTLKVVKELIKELTSNTKRPMNVRHPSNGKTIGYEYFNAYDNKKGVINSARRLNMSWGEVNYEPNVEGYVVHIHPYMCMPAVVKVFKGKTHEVYEQALKWVADNTMKRNYFTVKVPR